MRIFTLAGTDTTPPAGATTQQRVTAATHKAHRLYPPVTAAVLADEMRYATELWPWLGPNARAEALINEILSINEPTDTDAPGTR